MAFLRILIVILALCLRHFEAAQVLLIGEQTEKQLVDLFLEGQSAKMQVKTIYVDHDIEEESDQIAKFCSHLDGLSFAAIVDMTWAGWEVAEKIAKDVGIPYIKIEVSLFQLSKCNLQVIV